MRFATIDVGTNTAQLLVVESTAGGLRRIHVAERFVRLGEGVDASGRIGDAAQRRLLSTLRDHVATAQTHGATRIVATATSAMRDAANQAVVVERVAADVGVSVEILSGEEEAAWSFAAACAPFDDLTGPCLVVDVGGGSTELVTGVDASGRNPRDAMTGRVSVDVGCIRLTERCLPSLPPSDAAVSEADRLIDAALDDGIARSGLDAPPDTVLIGTAGTASALARVDAGPDAAWDALAGTVGGGVPVLSADVVRSWRNRLCTLSVDDTLALHPDAMQGRADVFLAGVLILDRVLTRFGTPTLRVSPYELRHGLALRASSEHT